MLNIEDRSKLFEARIRCAINRIKLRNLTVLTSRYGICRRPTGSGKSVWGRSMFCRAINPLSVFIEDKDASIGKISAAILKDIQKVLGMRREEILAFNYGLKGAKEHFYSISNLMYKHPDCREYFMFGAKIRNELKGKK